MTASVVCRRLASARILCGVARKRVYLDELIDATDVAQICGLTHRNNVSLYQHRYPDMPRPVVQLGPGRPMLWLRPEVEKWAAQRVRKRGAK